MGNCWRSGGTEAVAYSHRDTFQSRPIVHYYFTYATILSDTHMCDTEQLLDNRNENMK